MTLQMLAALVESPGHEMLLDQVDVADLAPGEVLVRVDTAAVCATDLHIMEGLLPFPMPAICGHEVAGVVADVGGDVSSLAPGARVVLNPRPPCGVCYWCVRHQEQLCAASMSWATGLMADGGSRLTHRGRTVYRGVGLAGFAEYCVVPQAAAIPIPDDMPMQLAAVVGCAVMTGVGAVFNTAAVEPGDTVVVLGLGGVGGAMVQAARIAGARLIVGVDPLLSRRDQGLRLGAHAVVSGDDGVMEAMVAELTGGIGADHVLDAAGDVAMIERGVAVCRPGGTVVLAGLAPATIDRVTVSTAGITTLERTVKGSFMGSGVPRREIERIVGLWRSGVLDLDAALGPSWPLAEINQALDAARTGGTGRVTVVAGQP
jgi:Zn-dependent alcohol dehydrogenase